MMKRAGLAFLASALLCGSVSAEPAKWGARIDLEGKVGTDRSLGEADMLLPLMQDSNTLLFANARVRLDDDDGREGNFGLGVRHMLDSGWNLGGYGYFDRRRTSLDNMFSQFTMGVEALGPVWDFRANGYLPVGTTQHEIDGLNTTAVSGGNVLLYGGEEIAMKGLDAEIGWRAPVFDEEAAAALRIYAGGYHFFVDEGTAQDITGVRGRLELTFDDVPGLWEGSRLSLGAEVQHDDPRGTEGFLFARLRIPLQGTGTPSSRLTAQERRMADPVVRDVDIVTQTGTFGAAEIATAANGSTLSVIDSASAPTTAALNNALTAAGNNSTVILSGTFNTNNTVNLRQGQTVIGTGNVVVRGASGRTAVFSGAGATINAATNTSSIGAITMANDSTLQGMVINQTQNPSLNDPYGVNVSNRSNVAVLDNVITVTSTFGTAFGVFVLDSSNVTVQGNTVSAIRPSGTAAALYINNSSAMVADNVLSTTGNVSAIYATFMAANSGNTVTIQAGSTGNVFLSGICDTAGSGTFNGSFGYTSGGVPGTCP